MPNSNSWRKPDPELVDRFGEVIAGVEGIELRRMFGYPAAFVGSNMTAMLHEDAFVVRLPENDRADRLAAGWPPFEPTGRRFREYVGMPAEVMADVDAARSWIARSAAYVSTLPPKEPKTSRRPKATATRRA